MKFLVFFIYMELKSLYLGGKQEREKNVVGKDSYKPELFIYSSNPEIHKIKLDP